MKLIPVLLSVVVACQLLPGQTIGSGRLLLSPDDPLRRAAYAAVLEDGLAAAGRLYGQAGLRIAGQPGLAVDLTVVEESAVLAIRAPGGEQTASFAVFDPSPESLGPLLPNLVAWLWASRNNWLAAGSGRAPGPVDDISIDALLRFIPFPSGIAPPKLYPSSVSVRANGNLDLGLGSLCLELDPLYRVVSQPGRSLYDRESRYYAYKVSGTPGGSLYFASSMDGDLYRLGPGETAPRRIRTGVGNVIALQALADGSVVVPDLARRQAWRFDGTKKSEFPVYAGKYSYPMAFAGGPDGNLWLFDNAARLVRIWSPGGRLLGAVAPLAPQEALAGVQSMAVFSNGDFVLGAGRSLRGFTRLGLPRWIIEDSGLSITGLACDSARGLVYLVDMMNRTLARLVDGDWCRLQNIRNPGLEKLAAISTRLAANPEDPVILKERAALYEELGASEAAYAGYRAVMEANPGDRQAAERVAVVDGALLLQAAAGLAVNAEQTLEKIGLESARPLYTQAMQAYENYLARFPADAAARAGMDRLKRAFLEKSAAPERRPDELVAEKAVIENLFPALINSYRDRPVGSVAVRNISQVDLVGVSARLFMKNFMDYAVESPTLALLPAGAVAELPLRIQFNTAVLGLQEDLLVQALVEISWRAGARAGTVSRSVPVTLYRQTALSWEDSARLASFVTPNEETVSGFAHRALAVSGESGLERAPVISRVFGRAMRLIEALGLYGINYVPDPATPITLSLGRREMIDTVRFPRTTLALRSGDCDDTSALTAALLESVGIETAILTTPGHVLIAFDSGEKAAGRRLLEFPPYVFLEKNGRLWVPIETTELAGGFLKAWRLGAELAGRHKDRLEFIPLKAARERYPALPLPPAALTIVEPAEARISLRTDGALAALETNIMQPLAGRYEREAVGARPEEAARLLNSAAGVRARFGDLAGAAVVLKGVVANAPGYRPAALNLAAVERLMSGEGVPAVVVALPSESGRAASAGEQAALDWRE